MKKLRWGLALAASLLLSLSFVPSAQAITVELDVFNTGVDPGGSVLPDGTEGDPHWTLSSVPTGTTDIRIRQSEGGYPIPPYLGDNDFSAWIGPNNHPTLSSQPGTYTFVTSFDVSNILNPRTVVLAGQISSDNDIIGFEINGFETGITTDFAGFTTWEPFSITADFFQTGLNTIEVLVNNGGTGFNPTALRVEFQTATAEVPAPAALALFLLGLTGVGVAKRRRI